MITSSIRIPEEIWNEIAKIAQEEERSVNSQIVYIFKKYLEQQKKEESKDSKNK